MIQGSYRNLFSFLFSTGIIALTLYISQEFLQSIAWAAIIAIASWSIYEWWLTYFNNNEFIASLTLVALISMIILIPCIYLGYTLTRDLHLATLFLIKVNQTGIAMPEWINEIPFISKQIQALWEDTLAKPNGLSELISMSTFTHVKTFSLLAFKNVGGLVWHRLFVFGFSMLTLFYFFKDGKRITEDIHHIGETAFARRWQRYVTHLPTALRATINGIVLVAAGVGMLMGMSYSYLTIPAPALMGIITSLFACVPFGAPVVFIVLAGYLLVQGLPIAALGLIIWGTLVMFVADHIIRPALIGGAARLPFLTVLFGILGGISCFGLLGLFVGPMIMVMFVTLWQEWTSQQNGSMKYA